MKIEHLAIWIEDIELIHRPDTINYTIQNGLTMGNIHFTITAGDQE